MENGDLPLLLALAAHNSPCRQHNAVTSWPWSLKRGLNPAGKGSKNVPEQGVSRSESLRRGLRSPPPCFLRPADRMRIAGNGAEGNVIGLQPLGVDAAERALGAAFTVPGLDLGQRPVRRGLPFGIARFPLVRRQTWRP